MKTLQPLQFMPIILKLTLAGQHNMFTTTPGDASVDVVPEWELSGMSVIAEECVISPELTSALAEKLSSGIPMNIPYETTIAFQLAIPGSSNPTIVVNRALSKLNEVWCVFAEGQGVHNEDTRRGNQKLATVNELFLPSGSNPTLQVQIGSKRYPYRGGSRTHQ